IINDSLELGTMFPYIIKAQELGWGILIFNPNENMGNYMREGEVVDRRPIPGSESPQQHSLYVAAKAEKILMVAHSYGGISTTTLLDERKDEFRTRVKVVALTDSVHSAGMVPSHSQEWFRKNTYNWIKSNLPFDTPIKEANRYYGCKCVSAGHIKHEYTSGMAIESVFEFLKWGLKKDNKTVNGNGEAGGKFEDGAASANKGLKFSDEEKENNNTNIEDPMEEDDDLSKSKKKLDSDNVKLKSSSQTKDKHNSLKTPSEKGETIKEEKKDDEKDEEKPNSENITNSNNSDTEKPLVPSSSTSSGNEVTNSITNIDNEEAQNHKNSDLSSKDSTKIQNGNLNENEHQINDTTGEDDGKINSIMESSAIDLKASNSFDFDKKAS
ncbi:9873_t:CDS:2, partial [Ambispora leptoticha]